MIADESRAGTTAPVRTEGTVVDLQIGHHLRVKRGLSEDQVGEVLRFQRRHGMRFGEAAIALGLATGDDVLWALSKQFHYPYAPERRSDLDPELVAAADPFSDDAEVFRDMRSRLMAETEPGPDQPARALAVVSTDVGDGKTYFAANLAVAYGQLGVSTLLVDADMRTPRLHRLFALDEGAGLSGVLSGRPEPNVIRRIDSLPTLHVLPVGALPPNPLELVQRPAFGLLMRELLTRFEHVIVDTPSASHGADARVIADKCGAALVIGRRGLTRMRALQRLLTDLGRTNAKVAGVMVNEH
jgi:receptor protein-tyrosine kinase